MEKNLQPSSDHHPIKDIKYKTKEYKGLEKAVSEAQSDLENAETEYKAVMEYFEKLKD